MNWFKYFYKLILNLENMLEESIKLAFFIKRSKLLKNGEAPIFCRISDSKSVSEFGIKKSVFPDFWLSDVGHVSHKHGNSKLINRTIERIRSRVDDINDDLMLKGEIVEPKEIKNILFEIEKQRTILEVFDIHNKKIEKLKGIDFSSATVQKYKSLYKHLSNYITKEFSFEDYPLYKFNEQFIEGFEAYLKADCKIGHNTSTKYLQSLNKIARLAIKNGWLKKNPFDDYTLRLHKVEKDYLTFDELKIIMEKKLDFPRIEKVRDIFVFCCFTGLAYADVKSLTKKDVSVGIDGRMWIKKKRTKTNIMSMIPLISFASDILEKYEDSPELNEKNLILPVNSNQKMNAYLKELGDICKINKYISTHTARHTFATSIALDNGLSLEATSKMLGHSNIGMTAHYARTTENLVSKNFEKLIEKFE